MKKVVTVCPYCASGCKINLVVDKRQNRPGGGSAGENQPGYPVSEGLLWLGLH